MGKRLIKVRINCLFYFNLAFCYELCDFPQIMQSDAIWGQLCEIATSLNIRWPERTEIPQLQNSTTGELHDNIINVNEQYSPRNNSLKWQKLICTYHNFWKPRHSFIALLNLPLFVFMACSLCCLYMYFTLWVAGIG